MLAGFGWARPVPVNARNLLRPVRDMALVAIAGPLSNFVTAFVALVLLVITSRVLVDPFVARPVGGMLQFVYTFNLGLGIFNLIPLPPLDGGHFSCRTSSLAGRGLGFLKQGVNGHRSLPRGFVGGSPPGWCSRSPSARPKPPSIRWPRSASASRYRLRPGVLERRHRLNTRRPGLSIDPGAVVNYPGSDLLSHAVSSAVPSALEGLTSVFGMGTGVAPPAIATGNRAWPIEYVILECSHAHVADRMMYECNVVKPHGRLVPVS